ncbi:MAG: cysteine--tRNA ligase [Chloroflexi bacterium]|nr:cysteine--tRNA ligase [Chloroflexota bacterium]
MPLILYNTLSRTKEEFHPSTWPAVKMYTCGPTVFRSPHLGNLRSFILADILRRTLEYNGYQVYHVKNITDIGHMEQEHQHPGEDDVALAVEKGAAVAAAVAEFYTGIFHEAEKRLNILPAHNFPQASQHISEVIALIRRLMEQGFAYEVSGTVYFDIGRWPQYGRLSGNRPEELAIHRVEPDPQKRNPADFTLWRRAEPQRVEWWESPWGRGYPGWHIEDSAMMLKHVGEQVDLLVGGVDDIFPHHEDVMAQCEAATEKPLATYWIHGEHLEAEGERMVVIAENVITLEDLVTRGVDPLAFRYLCLTAHYRSKLHFTWESIRAAESALRNLRGKLAEEVEGAQPSSRGQPYVDAFVAAINNDLDMPRALGILWEVVRSALPFEERRKLAGDFDRVLGLGLAHVVPQELPEAALRLIQEREMARSSQDWARSDELRQQLLAMGIEVRDTPQGSRYSPRY